MGGVTESAVREVLREVKDWHVPVSLEDMGMLLDVSITGPRVDVAITYPCLACPAATMIEEDIRRRVGGMEGVEDVEVDVRWGAPWTKDDLSTDARTVFAEIGIQL